MILYRIFLIVVSPVIITLLVVKGLRCGDLRFIKQRLGFAYTHLPDNNLWFHCASVGEVKTALPLLHELHDRNPNNHFIVTTNTTTGAEIVSKAKIDYLTHVYLPFDWSSCVRRFLSAVQPTKLFVLETELWPTLFNECNKNDCPITILNGRLSSRTTSASLWIKKLHIFCLHLVTHVYARSDSDAKEFIELGANEKNVTVLGNLKYAPIETNQKTQQLTQREYIVIASTHNNEEEMLSRMWLGLNRDELLVIAPRHPERIKTIIKSLSILTTNISTRSKNDIISDVTKIFILDTVGELPEWFKNAKAVVMGGSFVPVGGHNLLEPAYYKNAILFGPHMENFSDETNLMITRDACIQVKDIDELTASLINVLDNAEYRENISKNAIKATEDYSDVVSKYADKVQA